MRKRAWLLGAVVAALAAARAVAGPTLGEIVGEVKDPRARPWRGRT